MMYFKEGKKMYFMNWLSVCLDKTYGALVLVLGGFPS